VTRNALFWQVTIRIGMLGLALGLGAALIGTAVWLIFDSGLSIRAEHSQGIDSSGHGPAMRAYSRLASSTFQRLRDERTAC
jgi:hypothetical protein